MKKIIITLMMLTLVSCSESNRYGKCIGIVEKENPKLEYNIHVMNTVLSIIFIETIFAPVLWATNYAKCPVGEKAKK